MVWWTCWCMSNCHLPYEHWRGKEKRFFGWQLLIPCYTVAVLLCGSSIFFNWEWCAFNRYLKDAIVIVFWNVSKTMVHQEDKPETFPPCFLIFQGCIQGCEDKLSRRCTVQTKQKHMWRGIKVLLREGDASRKWHFRLFGVVWSGDEMSIPGILGEDLMGFFWVNFGKRTVTKSLRLMNLTIVVGKTED